MRSNLENALRNTKQVEVPDSTFAKVDNVLRSLEKSNGTTHIKPIYRKSAVFTAATAILLVVFTTTTALAVAGVIDIGSFFRSIFDNETAAPYIMTGDDITVRADDNDSAPEVEVLSAFMDTAGGGLYLEMKITDPTGERLSDSLLFLSRRETGEYYPMNLYNPTDVEFVDELTVRIRTTLRGFVVSETGEITVHIDYIASNIIDIEYLPYAHSITAEHMIPVHRSFTIAVSDGRTLRAGEFHGYFEGIPAQVVVGATSVSVQIYGLVDVFEESPLVLYLTDETTIELDFSGAEASSDISAFTYPLDYFVHPEDVVRVTFRGVSIGG